MLFGPAKHPLLSDGPWDHDWAYRLKTATVEAFWVSEGKKPLKTNQGEANLAHPTLTQKTDTASYELSENRGIPKRLVVPVP